MNLQTFITIQNIEHYLKADKTFYDSVLLPHIKDAAETFLYPTLSKKFADKIFNGIITDATVVEYTREALINFAGSEYYDMAPLNHGSAGPYEAVSGDQKPIRLEVLDNAKSSRLAAGHRKINLLLIYLEENKINAAFSDWVTSDSFTEIHQFPISNVTEFEKFCPIRNNRSVFIFLKAAMFQAYENYIKPIIDLQQYATLTPIAEKTIEVCLKNALANLSYSYGIWDLATNFGYETIISLGNQTANRQKGIEKLALEMITAIETRKKAIGIVALAKATDIIIANTPAQSAPASIFYKNDPKSGIFNF